MPGDQRIHQVTLDTVIDQLPCMVSAFQVVLHRINGGLITPEGVPITEYLPEGHEGRDAYGIVKDPTPDKGRATAKVLERQHQEGER